MLAQRILMQRFAASDVWHGLSVREYDVLLSLSRAGGELRQCDLGPQWMIPQPTMSRLLDGLVAAGLVRKRPDPADGRSWLLRLTAEGNRVQRLIARGHVRDISRVLGAALTDEELAQLEALTHKLVERSKGEL